MVIAFLSSRSIIGNRVKRNESCRMITCIIITDFAAFGKREEEKIETIYGVLP